MKQVLWTCDKCGYEETTTEVFPPKTRDFYGVVVMVQKPPLGMKTKVCAEVLWCSDCCAEMKVLPVKTKAGEEKPPPPNLEDLVYEIACGALDNARP